jgi:hypothetical protein
MERDGALVRDWAPCGSTHAVDLGGQPDGAYTFAAHALDGAGNRTADAVWRFTLDRSAPRLPDLTAEPAPRDRDRTPSWEFESDPGARFECLVQKGAEVVRDWAECKNPLKLDLRESEDGSYTLSVRAFDEAGNAAEPVVTTYRLDTTDPDAPEITGKPGVSGTDRTPTWAFRGEPRATLECRLKQAGREAPDWRPCESPKTFDLDGRSLSAYTFLVRATDVAGNAGAAAEDGYELKAPADARGASPAKSQAVPGPAAPVAPGESPAPAAPATPAAPAPAAEPGDDPSDEKGEDDEAAGVKDGAGAGPGAKGGPGAGGAGPGRASPAAAAAAAEEERRRKERDRKRKKSPMGAAAETMAKMAAVIVEDPAKTAFPMSLIFVLIGFMGLQGRIDRNDPKLALAPVFADPDLEFRPPRLARAAAEES